MIYVIIENDIMFGELKNAVKKLDKLCKSTQIVRENVTTGEDIIDKVYICMYVIILYTTSCFLLDNVIFRALKIRYTSNSVSYQKQHFLVVLKEVQGQVKNIISNKVYIITVYALPDVLINVAWCVDA